MPFAELPWVRLAYSDRGRGPAVTLLHGFTQTRSSWEELLDLLPRGYRYVAPDLRGHGETDLAPQEPTSIRGCIADVESLWDRLEIPASHLVGYSMGGRVALHMAALGSPRILSLVCLGARAGLEGRDREARLRLDHELAARIEADGVSSFLDWWLSRPLFAGLARRGAAFSAADRQSRLGNLPQGLAASLREMGAAVEDPLTDAQLRSITCPALFLAGQQDETFLAEAHRLADLVPGGVWSAVPGAGHAAHLEDPAGVAAILSDHLSRRHRESAW